MCVWYVMCGICMCLCGVCDVFVYVYVCDTCVW